MNLAVLALRFLLRGLPPGPDDGLQRRNIEAVALALRVDVADVRGDGLFLLLEPLDPLDDRLQLLVAVVPVSVSRSFRFPLEFPLDPFDLDMD
jgi:hypothetical protein